MSNNVSPQLVSGGNISPATFVKLSASADNTALQAGANEAVIGISQPGTKDAPGLTGASAYAAEAGDNMQIFGLGDICLLKAGSGGYTRGDRLKSDASGNGVPIAESGVAQNVGAIALESAAASEYGRVQIVILSVDPTADSDSSFDDDEAQTFGAEDDAQMLWSTGDASNHSFVVALGDTNQSLHITDVGAKATDWNVSADTHPSLYIHSNTTPATDYLRIGTHTGTAADIDVVGGTTLNLKIAGTSAAHVTASGIDFIDDVGVILGTGIDAKMIWSTGDASDHSVVLALGDTSQMLHITDLGAVATDWAITSPTHPTLYIHSNTTPSTDYLLIGTHDGTSALIDVVGGSDLKLKLAGTEYASVRVTGLAVGTYVAAMTAGTDQLTLKATGTAPSGTGANVGHLYADFETDDDELFWLSGTGGTATQLTT